MRTPEEDLKKIEFQKRTWREKFLRENDIWRAICQNINSTKGKEQKHWEKVMNLFNEKYRKL